MLGQGVISSASLHTALQRGRDTRSGVLSGALRGFWRMRSAGLERLRPPLHRSVYCYRMDSQPSDRDINPAPLGKQTAGGRGGGGMAVGDPDNR